MLLIDKISILFNLRYAHLLSPKKIDKQECLPAAGKAKAGRPGLTSYQKDPVWTDISVCPIPAICNLLIKK
jgi:hypothetical protein